MPGKDGIEVVEALTLKGLATPVIIMTGHGSVELAVQALKAGAYDFIEKPLDLNRVLVALRNATDREELRKETVALRQRKRNGDGHDMVGQSPALEEIRGVIAKVAPTDARVMITGANGTGKEVVARHIHAQSGRKGGPFIEVNCAAIPAELIESELFGHEKGAFTSAVKQRKGRFEQAQGGTLFLDEIGTWRCRPRPRCSGPCKRRSSNGWAETRTFRSTSGSSQPPTRTSVRNCGRAIP